MKRTLSIALAVLTIGLLGSCSKINERLDNLEKKVDGIESEQIASINTQIASINSSIADLGQIRSDISSLKQSAENHGQDIFALQEADETLGNRIDNLEDYLDNVLPNYAEKEWVKATFSTLAQYEATCDTIAKIDARIGALDNRLSKDIKACADSLSKWVNKQFEAYYTAAEMDAKLAQMKSAVDSAKAAGKISDAKFDSLATELAKTKTAVDTAKAAVRAEYKAAVKAAIEESEGKLTRELTDKITTVNTDVTNLTTKVTKLENDVTALTGRIDKLEKMIQSVSIIPAYSDGSVEALDGDLTLRCIVSPADALDGMQSLKDSLLLYADSVKVKTRAATSEYMKINVSQATVTDGVITLKAKINEYLPKGAGRALTVALNIKNGISNFTTEFVTVTDIPFVDLGVTNAAGKPLYWAKCNLGADNPQDPGDYFMWGATALMYTAVDYSKTDDAFTFVTANPYGDNYKNTWDNDANFNWKFIPFADGTYSSGGTSIIKNVFTKYTTSNVYAKSDTPDNLTTLKPEDDAATVENPNWRMPTIDDFKSLVANCVLVWTSDYNSTSKAGYIVYKANNDSDKGKACIGDSTWKMWDATNSKYVANTGTEPTGYFTSTDPHIFLPVTGYGATTKLQSYGTNGAYLTSALDENNNSKAYAFSFMSNAIGIGSNDRRNGYPIRPVTE